MGEQVFLPIFYFVVAWLACWAIDLIVLVARSPAIPIDPVLKLVVVLVCLVFLLIRVGRAGWIL
jgi:hypothetical protein